MISDLLTLRKELISASDASEVAEKKARLTEQVQREISALFDDPKYPERRRSFGVIRKRLGIFDENDPELREILFAMGARVHRGEGEDALWELRHAHAPISTVRPKRPLRFRLGLIALVCAVVLVAVNTLSTTLTGTSLLALLQDLLGPTQTHEDCLKAANGTMTEILKCNQTHG